MADREPTITGAGTTATDNNGEHTAGTALVRASIVAPNAGQQADDVDFGFVGVTRIGDKLFRDTDNDGVQDAGEPGMDGVRVALLDDNGDEIAFTTTDPTGAYEFTSLNVPELRTPGTPLIVEVVLSQAPLAGLQPTQPNVGGDETVDSDGVIDPLAPRLAARVPLTLGPRGTDHSDDADVGFVPQFNVGDLVFADVNGNGVQDTGENGIESVVVRLLDTSGNELRTTTTDANGQWTFNSLADRSVLTPDAPRVLQIDLTQTALSELQPSPTGAGTPATDSDGELNASRDAATATFTTPSFGGASNEDLDFGFVRRGAAGGLVWLDEPGTGVQETSDNTPIAGVVVTLLTPDGTVVATTSSDVDGIYLFDTLSLPLTPGDYVVALPRTQVPELSGLTHSPPLQGSDPQLDSNGQYLPTDPTLQPVSLEIQIYFFFSKKIPFFSRSLVLLWVIIMFIHHIPFLRWVRRTTWTSSLVSCRALSLPIACLSIWIAMDCKILVTLV